MPDSADTTDTGGGLRQQRAARLRAEMEEGQKGHETSQAQRPESDAESEAQQPSTGRWHIVAGGETVRGIAAETEHSVEEIWEHPNNEQLRRRRGGPEGVEPNDALFVPGTEPAPDEPDTGPIGQGEHVVKQGDCIASIAHKSGHFWETIWNDPANSELKEVRGDPNVLLPDDLVTLPELREKTESGATEMRHRFRRRGEPASVHIILRYKDGTPVANKPYIMYIDDQTHEGTTDANGALHARVPSTARRGSIRVPELGMSWPLRLGHLDPIHTNVGVKARLNNLGYSCGPEGPQITDQTRAAIKGFQADNALDPTGILDQATRDKIVERHGS